jgi:DNA polymerase
VGIEDNAPGTARVATTMKGLEAQVKTCQLCRLSKTRTQAVPGEGDYHAEVMFIGEGPGYHEDRQGRPFVGAAGQFLNELLGLAGLSRAGTYIANVVKCRPPNNRDPNPDEIAACAPYLERQVALIDPKVIVTLGRYSMAHYFPGERISQIHGSARVVDGRICVAMYHPAAGLHQGSLADIIRADFRKLPAFIEQARRMSRRPAQAAVAERLDEALEDRAAVVSEIETGSPAEADPAPHIVDEAGNVATEAAEPVDAPPSHETPEKKKPGEDGDGLEQLSFL